MSEATEKYQQAGPKVQPRQKEEMVYVWPYLVSIEAIMAVVMTLSLALLSTFLDAPTLDLANPEVTPNPAKAPWYFLGLQELLLHMHPALAGVIVPGAALLLLGMIPYLDRDKRGTGIWFSTKKGWPITIFSSIYTSAWILGLVLIDEFMVIGGQKGIERSLTLWLNESLPFMVSLGPGWDWLGRLLVPSVLMVLIPALLTVVVKRRWRANTREVMIALFTFYFVSFMVLTVLGTAFRGHSMDLVWPWELLQGGH